MADNTSTTTPGMQTAAGYLADTQNTAQSGLSTVESVTDTLRGTWRGETSVIFYQAINAWIDDCSYIIGRLGDMIETLDRNRHVIDSGEAQNLGIAHHIPVGPGLGI